MGVCGICVGGFCGFCGACGVSVGYVVYVGLHCSWCGFGCLIFLLAWVSAAGPKGEREGRRGERERERERDVGFQC